MLDFGNYPPCGNEEEAVYVVDGRPLGAGAAGFEEFIHFLSGLPAGTTVVDISWHAGISPEIDPCEPWHVTPWRRDFRRVFETVERHDLRFVHPERIGWEVDGHGGPWLLTPAEVRRLILPLKAKRVGPTSSPSRPSE